MTRVWWRSFVEPLRSPALALTLAIAACVVWGFVFVALLLTAEFAEQVPWIVSDLLATIEFPLLVPAFVLAVPMVASEARDRTLLLNLMKPIPRPTYFAARVTGRAALAAVYFAVVVSGLWTIVVIANASMFERSLDAVAPDVGVRLGFSGLAMVSVVLSLAALAPVASSRFAHVGYWAGLYVVVLQCRGLVADPLASAPARFFSRLVVEVLGPMVSGADSTFVREAAFGPWYLARALTQWGFGATVALLIGMWAFSKMEVATRT